MIKKPAARVAAVAILLGGLAATALLNRDDSDNTTNAQVEVVQLSQFFIRWRAGALVLSGLTVSEDHERALLQIATSAYPDASIDTDFQTMSLVPNAWERTSTAVLTAMAVTIASTAEISATAAATSIAIRAVVDDEPQWRMQLAALTQALPESATISVDRVLLDKNLHATDLCRQAFSRFDSGPINFEESSATFRSSAYPNLAKIVALAATCTEGTIKITGHTDGTGPAAWNQRLSHDRAAAVRDYIVANGIDADRLRIAGAGSSSPIATNATRYGRSFNRRIEIEFLSTPASSSAAAQY